MEEGILPQPTIAEAAQSSQGKSTGDHVAVSEMVMPPSTAQFLPTSFTPAFPEGTAMVSQEAAVSPDANSASCPRIFLDVCSGSTRPLSKALLALHKTVLSIDILLCSEMDLLNDSFYLQLLRLCASGIVAYTACSPSCAEYSKLKLKPGGPPALRSPQHLEGLPGLTAEQLTKVQDSYTMLYRCTQLLQATYAAGGHGHLEQPPTAMSWEEDCSQQWIQSAACCCIHLAACHFDKNWNKAWLFATSFPPLSVLGCTCEHDRNSHENIMGKKDASGRYVSRLTAEYPSKLAEAFANIVAPLIDSNNIDLSMSNVMSLLPIKGITDPPFAVQDGAGFVSSPDWSLPQSLTEDTFGTFRRHWMSTIIHKGWHKRILAHFSAGINSPVFDDKEVQLMRTSLTELLQQHGLPINWDIPEHQPLALHILSSLSQLIKDPDKELFSNLIQGVPTGFKHDIPLSHCFAQVEPDDDAMHEPLSVHMSSWKSAHDDEQITEELIQIELDRGWLEPYQGTLTEFQQEYPEGISIGKLGVATSPSRPPRLVVDSTICGLNKNCWIPEKGGLPSAKDAIRCYPLRNSSCTLWGLSIDIKSAHKLVKLRPSERGLVSFSWKGKIFVYRVCPFGASFSAHWWGRLGGCILRLMHRIAYLAHSGMLYVDDFIFTQDAQVLPTTAAMWILFLQAICLPISWRKCELSHTINWIGWRFCFVSGIIMIHPDKCQKLLDLISQLQRHRTVPVKTLQKFLGLMLWITQLFPYLRIWLHYLFRDLHSIPATQYSLDPSQSLEFRNCLNTDLIFTAKPPGTAIPPGSKLLEMRHKTINSLEDVRHVFLSDKRLWVRVRDPESSKRKLCEDSVRMLAHYKDWIRFVPPLRTMWPKQIWPHTAAADACAHGDIAQIGGFLVVTSDITYWFSERFSQSDFQSISIPVNSNMQRDIVSYETLAQIAVVTLLSQHFPSCRYPICIHSLSDNTGAEAGSNALFSTQLPQCLFLERLCLLASITGIDLDVSHIAGAKNELADTLSRLTQYDILPDGILPEHRIRFELKQLLHSFRKASLHPPNAYISWSLPTGTC